MLSLPQRLQQLRQERGLTQVTLAQQLGFPRQAVEHYETGRQTPSQLHQQKLAEFFNVSLAYLRGETVGVETELYDEPRAPHAGRTLLQELDEEPLPETPRADRFRTRSEARKAEKGEEPAPKDTSGAMLDALLFSPLAREKLRAMIRDELRSPTCQEIIRRVVREEIKRMR